jgi:hypothetical protein
MKSTSETETSTVGTSAKAAPRLLVAPIKVINVGLDRFASDLESQGTEVVQVDWAPPARGNARLAALLAKLGG